MSTYLLIDGNSLTYRAFFGLPTDLATTSGQITNAVFGFTSMLINTIRDHKPDAAVVAFDRPEPTFRHERIPTYKAGRKETPDILIEQFGLVREVIEVLGIPMVEKVGVEADDILATLATQIAEAGDDVIIMTGDRDVYQMVSDPHIKVLYNKRGVSDYGFYDEAGILERTGVRPEKYVMYASMRGDNSDNLPGVPGVGEKTAAKLLDKYGDLDGIFAHLDEQTPKLSENLAAHEDQVRSNHEVMQLLTDVELDIDLGDATLGTFDPEAVKKLFEFLQFDSLLDRLSEAFGDDVVVSSGGEVLEPELPEVDDLVAALERATKSDSPIAIDVSDDGIALATVDSVDVVWIPAADLRDAKVAAAVATLLSVDGPGVTGHGVKAMMRLLSDFDLDIAHLVMDTELAAYLIDPAGSSYDLGELLARYAGFSYPRDDDSAQGTLDFDGDAAAPELLAARRALAVSRLAPALREALDAQGLTELHDSIEAPLVRVLSRMERVGVQVDVDELRSLNEQMQNEGDRLRQEIWKEAGREFNVNSTPQLREVLFDELGLTPGKKTKTGYSTDAASLEKIADQHPIVQHLLRYREVEKLRSTYGEGLSKEVQSDGRIHATFNQTVARTGRLSSDKPNLHNIPVRSAEGRQFRKAFIATPGFELLVADYNQIELRCIAHLAEDPGLIGAFESGTDIHSATAARVFDIDIDAVSTEQRAKSKMVSYGLAYGMEAYGLGQRLGIPTGEAKEILEAYFEAFPNVHAYMDAAVEEARQRGYTETLFGRRRPIPELSARNFRVRQAGERQAMNAGIQGLAADIFKVALVRLDKGLEEADGESRLILQVHDEVIVEVTPDEKDDVTELTVGVMHDAFDLRVPLEVNLSFGATWADAKG